MPLQIRSDNNNNNNNNTSICKAHIAKSHCLNVSIRAESEVRLSQCLSSKCQQLRRVMHYIMQAELKVVTYIKGIIGWLHD